MPYSNSLFERISQHANKRFGGAQTYTVLLHNAYTFYRTEKEAVFRLHNSHVSSLQVCASYSLMASLLQKEVLKGIFREFPQFEALNHFTLLALGEFGRNESFPYCTLDMVCLYEDETDFDANHFKDIFLTHFTRRLQEWGIKINCLIDTLPKFIEQFPSSAFLVNSSLSARYITGNFTLFQKLQKILSQYMLHNPNFLCHYWLEQKKRHKKFGDTFELREPNIVNGIGGLKDLQEWLNFEQSLHQKDLFDEDIFGANQLSIMHEFLLRLRNALYFIGGSDCEVLYSEKLSSIAKTFVDAEKQVYENAYEIVQNFHEIANKILKLHLLSKTHFFFKAKSTQKLNINYFLGKKLDGFRVKNGFLSAEHPKIFEEQPSRLIRVFYYLQRLKVRLAPNLLKMLIKKDPYHLSLAHNREANDTFMSILSESGNVYPPLAKMSIWQIFNQILPEFSHVDKHLSGQHHHRPYTTNLHILKSVQALDELFNSTDHNLKPYQEALAKINEPKLIYLSLILHDFINLQTPQESVKIAKNIFKRLNLSLYQREYVLFLIRNHSKMIQYWSKKNVYDPETHKAFAGIVKDSSRLHGLYIHSFCDLKSTNESLWNNHKMVLHQILYTGTLKYLDQGKSNTNYLSKLEKQLKTFSVNSTWETDVKEHLAQTPQSHLVLFPTKALKNHIEYVKYFKETKPTYAYWLDTSNFGANTLTVVTSEPDILVKICTALASENFSILTLKTSVRKDNIYVFSFEIASSEIQPIKNENEKTKFLKLIQKACSQKVLHKLDKQTLKNFSPNKTATRYNTPTSLNIYNDTTENKITIEIKTTDQRGLLYQIFEVFSSNQFEVLFAHVRTENEYVFDTFHIRPLSGRPNLVSLREQLSPIVLRDY